MTTPGTRGYYEGTDKDGHFFRIPRHVDPAIDGTTRAAHHPKLFDVSVALNSVPLAQMDAMIEAQVPPEVIDRIEHVMAAGRLLAQKGLADAPPIVEREWRRGMILSWSHARDLVVVHAAMGHPREVTGHDTDEVVFGRRLQERLVATADQWYRDYVQSLDLGALVNVGFFNPHISASMYRWGDAKGGVQNAMDAHRLAAHHQGTPEHPLDWVERAVNFVVHHIPREHWGIRHEPRGEWSDLEVRMAEDPAIKDAEIGKVIARDAAQLFALLENEGKVVPWHLLAVPHETKSASMIEHAHLVVLAARRRAGEVGLRGDDDDEDEAMNSARVARAEAVLAALPGEIDAATRAGQLELASAYTKWLNHHG